MIEIEYHPDASEEYLSAIDHYESKDIGLGLKFFTAVESSKESIRNSPETWPVLEDKVRRKLLHKYPYCILYTFDKNQIFIIAIMHLKRRPGYWKYRI